MGGGVADAAEWVLVGKVEMRGGEGRMMMVVTGRQKIIMSK